MHVIRKWFVQIQKQHDTQCDIVRLHKTDLCLVYNKKLGKTRLIYGLKYGFFKKKFFDSLKCNRDDKKIFVQLHDVNTAF